MRLPVAAVAAVGLALALGPAPAPLQGQEVSAGVLRLRERPTGWIGFTVDIELLDARAAARRRARSMVISDVHPDGPAALAGLRPGDAVVAINGQPLTDETIDRFQASLEPGTPVRLTYRRAGRERSVTLRVAPRPDDDALVSIPAQVRVRLDSAQAVFLQQLDSAARASAAKIAPAGVFFFRESEDSVRVLGVGGSASAGAVAPAPTAGVTVFDMRWSPAAQEATRAEVEAQLDAMREDVLASARAVAAVEEHRRPLAPYILGQDWIAGARLTPLNEGLAPYFGIARGLLVVEVADGTPAADAGIVPGDVIVAAAGERRVGSIDELRMLLMASHASVPLTVIRKGRQLAVSLPH